MMSRNTIGEKTIYPILLIAHLCSCCRMIHTFLRIFMNLFLKFLRILSYIMEHSSAISPISFSKYSSKIPCLFRRSIQMLFQRLNPFILYMSPIIHLYFLPKFCYTPLFYHIFFFKYYFSPPLTRSSPAPLPPALPWPPPGYSSRYHRKRYGRQRPVTPAFSPCRPGKTPHRSARPSSAASE